MRNTWVSQYLTQMTYQRHTAIYFLNDELDSFLTYIE